MKKTGASISLLLVLFAGSCSPLSAVAAAETDIIISGIAKAADGHYFAIARNYGLLKKGDLIPISTDTESFELKVIAIDDKGLHFQKLDVKTKEVKPPPPEPKRKIYEFRDPFWPIGYEPQ